MASDIIELHASIDGGPERKFVGRFAWALSELVRAGQKGVTPLDEPSESPLRDTSGYPEGL